MPFFIVYDPPGEGNGPYLIGNRKGSRDKEFANYYQAAKRLGQCGKSAKNCSKIHEFSNLADATSHCVTMRDARRSKVIVTTKKKPPEGGLLAHRVIGDQSVGLPELAPDVSAEPVLVDEPEAGEDDGAEA